MFESMDKVECVPQLGDSIEFGTMSYVINLGNYVVKQTPFTLTGQIELRDNKVEMNLFLPKEYPSTLLGQFYGKVSVINIVLYVGKDNIMLSNFFFIPKLNYNEEILTEEEALIFKPMMRFLLCTLVRWIFIRSGTLSVHDFVNLKALGHVATETVIPEEAERELVELGYDPDESNGDPVPMLENVKLIQYYKSRYQGDESPNWQGSGNVHIEHSVSVFGLIILNGVK
jgi:hypothetical protein